ncbi:MAG: hypothetical protein M9924_00600 [Rhizobiaceae bacterium]|nr:hypothetical protein [Rhizobiaceae bacterium]
MIFVTIGSMFPFDRLIRVMDGWAQSNPGTELLAQIGTGSYLPAHMPYVRKLTQSEFSSTVERAKLVVAHAGMGSVITASQYGKPIVMLPRLQEWGEHTTDHQIATANWLRTKPGVFIADTDAELAPRIADALETDTSASPIFSPNAQPEFVARLRGYIFGQS